MVQKLLLLGCLALIVLVTHPVQLCHLLHLAELALFNPLSQLIVQNGFLLQLSFIKIVREQPSQVKVIATLMHLLLRLIQVCEQLH